MSSSNCCFLTCIQVSQEEVRWSGITTHWRIFHSLLWYTQSNALHSQWSRSRCFSGIPLLFSMIQWTLTIWSLVPLAFLNPAWASESSLFTYCWSLAWRILSITLLACEMRAIANILGKTLLAFALLHFVLQGQFACFSRYLLTSYFIPTFPLWWKGHLFEC